jgi:hypothetical protein
MTRTLLLIVALVLVSSASPMFAAAPAPAAPAPAAPAAAAPAAPAPAAGEKLMATVKAVSGTVESRTAVGQPWAPVAVGQQLPEGTDLRTGFRARCTLEMMQSAVQVEPLTVLRIGELHREGDKVKTRLLLKQGNTEAAVDKGGTKNDFAIVTPSATLSVRGTQMIQAGYFTTFGGTFALTQEGLIALVMAYLGTEVTLHPGQKDNDQGIPPWLWQILQNLNIGIDQQAFTQAELLADLRNHTFMPIPINDPGTRALIMGALQRGQEGTGSSSSHGYQPPYTPPSPITGG